MKIDVFLKGSRFKFYKNNSQDHFLYAKEFGGLLSKKRFEVYDLINNKIADVKVGLTPWFCFS